MQVKFVDLKIQLNSIRPQIEKAISDVLDECVFVSGNKLKQFEQEFAAFSSAKYAIGVGNGTDALFIALRALGIKNGDEVITVTNSFFATSEAVAAAGAEPVFVDIDETTYTIDISKIEEKITSKTKAILPVHLYGHPADMKSVLNIAKKYSLYVIEDCAQAHGALYNGKKVGTFGDIGCFSFFPSKNLGAFGDGGALVCNDEKLAEKIFMLRDHGRKEKYIHQFNAVNSRLDPLQAAILSVKLKYLNDWNQKRRNNAKLYNNLLKNIQEIVLPVEKDNCEHVYHLYVIKISKRDELQEYLKKANIETGIHYPVPLHLQPAYNHLKHKKGDFPVTEKLAQEVLSLPMYPELTEEAIKYVANKIGDFVVISEIKRLRD